MLWSSTSTAPFTDSHVGNSAHVTCDSNNMGDYGSNNTFPLLEDPFLIATATATVTTTDTPILCSITTDCNISHSPNDTHASNMSDSHLAHVTNSSDIDSSMLPSPSSDSGSSPEIQGDEMEETRRVLQSGQKRY